MGDEVSETEKELRKLLPLWAELTGAILGLIFRLLKERETK
jgi:hypothetical protein